MFISLLYFSSWVFLSKQSENELIICDVTFFATWLLLLCWCAHWEQECPQSSALLEFPCLLPRQWVKVSICPTATVFVTPYKSFLYQKGWLAVRRSHMDTVQFFYSSVTDCYHIMCKSALPAADVFQVSELPYTSQKPWWLLLVSFGLCGFPALTRNGATNQASITWVSPETPCHLSWPRCHVSGLYMRESAVSQCQLQNCSCC